MFSAVRGRAAKILAAVSITSVLLRSARAVRDGALSKQSVDNVEDAALLTTRQLSDSIKELLYLALGSG